MGIKNDILSNRLYELRTLQRIPQKVIAAAIGVAPPMYSRIEKGERRIKPEQLELLADFLHANKDELQSLWLVEEFYKVAKQSSQQQIDNAIEILKRKLLKV